MSDILIVYYSRSGNTEKMAHFIARGVTDEGVTADVKAVNEVEVRQLLDYKAIVVGSPTYYGLPAAEIVTLFDESVGLHGRLEGKLGAAFASSGNVGGGNETTCTGILQMMLVHGMLVLGSAQGDHYGPVSIGEPDKRVENMCRHHGALLARAVKRMGA